MAHFVLTDASVTLAGTDLSDHVKGVEFNLQRNLEDDTNMGDTWETLMGGVFSGTVTINFDQDFAASEVDAIVSTAFLAATGSALIVKPTSGAISATNPGYTGTVWVESYSPISGEHGAKARTSPTFRTSGTVDRDITP